ncbi:Fic family protein [Desulfovibrio sp. OttesenSCG-928-F20]|nr:Fic family protein [Desulfovibrio sp. OttesenSCG-928-F20]
MNSAKQNEMIARIDELQTKIAALRPYEGDMLIRLRKYYRLGLTWTSNAIEGSSYTESETKILLEDGITIGGKSLRDTFAAVGHAKAYDYMFTLLGQKGITENDILTLHSMMDGGLETGDAGKYRTGAVFVTGSTYTFPPAKAVPGLMRDLFDKTMPQLAAQHLPLHPVIQSARLHEELVAIHPFSDGNGRIARLAMNTVLIQNGFLPVQIYPVIRQQYIDSLREAQTSGSDTEFIELILRQEIESQKEILRIFEA